MKCCGHDFALVGFFTRNVLCTSLTEEEGRQTTDSDEPWGAIKGKAKVERDSAE